MSNPASGSPEQFASDSTYRKITLRIVPLLFLCYMLNYMDRVNIGYAQLQMKHALNLSDAIYGLSASIFFLGYFIFEVPSNLLLHKIGVRKTLLRIMLGWGLASACTMFVTTPMQFYIVRFFVGMFEAGLFPGMVLYLTYWYPPARRARVVALFMLATAAAGIVGGPIAGWILQNMNDIYKLEGWQWMFLIEGLPCCLVGIFAYFYLADSPIKASWLTDAQKSLVLGDVAAAAQTTAMKTRSAYTDPKVYLLSFVLFCILCGSYVIAFWLPTVIRELGVGNFQKIGFYAMIPDVLAIVCTILYSHHSDKHLERRWHFIIAALVGALALSATTLTGHSLGLSIMMFAIARAAIVSSLPIFWTMATSQLSTRSSIAGIAVISSMSNFSGMTSPFLIGLIKTATGSLAYGMFAISSLMVISALCVFFFVGREPRACDAIDPTAMSRA